MYKLVFLDEDYVRIELKYEEYDWFVVVEFIVELIGFIRNVGVSWIVMYYVYEYIVIDDVEGEISDGFIL